MELLSKRKICMNRQQRRKAGIKKKTATYNLTQEQLYSEIKKGVEEFRQELRTEAVDDALRVLAYVPLMVLRDKFGFGKVRLDKFLREFAELVDCVENDYVGFEDMIETIKDETGLVITDYIKF